MKKNAKVVIADDNEIIKQTLCEIFAELGIKLDTVSNGYELLSYIKQNSPKVVILDLVMPAKDGVTVFSAIKSISPQTKIIVHTGFEKYRKSPLAKKADRFILKGENPEELIRAVQKFTAS